MRIAFILITILALSVEAQAVKLDLDNPNGIAALYSMGSGIAENRTFVVCTDGTGYHMEVQEFTNWEPFVVSPVPIAEVVEWTPWMLYTSDGRWFARHSVMAVWEEMGVELTAPAPPCFEPVESDKQSFGDMKQMFK